MKLRTNTPVIIMLFVTFWYVLGAIFVFKMRSLPEGNDWMLDGLEKNEDCRSQAIVVDAFHKVSCDHKDHRLYLEPLAASIEKTKDGLPMVTENHWIARCVCTNQLQEEMAMSTCDREEHGAVQDARRLLDELQEFEKARREEAKEKK